MTQDERWNTRFEEVKAFIENNKRNPSKHRIEEHDMLNWMKANRKLVNAGKMKVERMEKFENKLCSKIPKSSYQWVLLEGKVSQKNEERERGNSIFWRVTTCLNWNALGGHAVEDLGSTPSHLFAFEIGWRKMKTTEDNYYDPGLGVPLLNRYEFSSWDNERDIVPHFYFLDEDICDELNLQFCLEDLSYYRNGEKVVEVYQSTSSSFYYLRQDMLEEILNKFNVHLDFEMYVDKTNLGEEIGGTDRYRNYRKNLTYEDVRKS